MKWSEQMRVLNSEDEHYNQLICDLDAHSLYINDKLIATLDEANYLDPNKFCDLKKKYPYIDDKNFLLNCLLKFEEETSTYTAQGETSQFTTVYFNPNSVKYTKSNMGIAIEVATVDNHKIYKFGLLKQY